MEIPWGRERQAWRTSGITFDYVKNDAPVMLHVAYDNLAITLSGRLILGFLWRGLFQVPSGCHVIHRCCGIHGAGM